MKKWIWVGLILVSSLVLISAVYAHLPGKGYGSGWLCNADSESVKKFQRDTLSLRDELISKRFEIREEYSKEKPDLDKIATLKKEIVDIRTEIRKKAQAAGLPAWKDGKIGCGKMKGKGLKGACCFGLRGL